MIPNHIRVMVSENLKTMREVDIVASLEVDAMVVSEQLLDTAQNATNLRDVFKQWSDATPLDGPEPDIEGRNSPASGLH